LETPQVPLTDPDCVLRQGTTAPATATAPDAHPVVCVHCVCAVAIERLRAHRALFLRLLTLDLQRLATAAASTSTALRSTASALPFQVVGVTRQAPALATDPEARSEHKSVVTLAFPVDRTAAWKIQALTQRLCRGNVSVIVDSVHVAPNRSSLTVCLFFFFHPSNFSVFFLFFAFVVVVVVCFFLSHLL
jgi:hypothetical protein